MRQKQTKRGRWWLTEGSCVRCRPTHRHHVWAYDFVADRTHDGRPLKILTVIEEYSRECLAILVARRLRAADVLETLAVVTHPKTGLDRIVEVSAVNERDARRDDVAVQRTGFSNDP